jgi:hypothetical protein
MDNTRKELADMKQTLNQLMSTIKTVEKENILLRSQAQLTKISGAKQTFQENASHTCEAKSDTRKAKPQVLLLGTSNVIGIRQDKLTTAADVTKVVRYTIKDTIEYIRSCSMSPDLIACHSLTNDLTKLPPDSCVQHVETLVSVIYKKWDSIKIIISLCTPRLDNINYQTNGEIINALIKQKTATSVDILICDHSNKLVNGFPSPEFLDDKLFHLSGKGISCLAENLKKSIHAALNIPLPQRDRSRSRIRGRGRGRGNLPG